MVLCDSGEESPGSETSPGSVFHLMVGRENSTPDGGEAKGDETMIPAHSSAGSTGFRNLG